MGSFGGYYKGDKRKPKQEMLERLAQKIKKSVQSPQIEITGKKGK